MGAAPDHAPPEAKGGGRDQGPGESLMKHPPGLTLADSLKNWNQRKSGPKMTTSAIGSSMGPQFSMRINGGPPPGAQAAMKPVAELLGMSSNDLATKLKGGTTIVDLAAEKDVSRDDAVSAIAAGLKANARRASRPRTTRSTRWPRG